MNLLFTLAGVLIGLGFFTGCDSPILNHAEANNQEGEVVHVTSETCPLSFKKETLCASMTWTKEPTDDIKGELTLRFWNGESGSESGPYVNPQYTVAVKLWMPGMGHGSSPVTVEQETDQTGALIDGVYKVSDIYFVMPGAWEIWVQFKQDRTVIDQAKKDYQY